ncbi:hypothetical protein C2G38_2041125 [Gigaspora rosea]|uniref:Uncharacterized protein n=1 Tax=Gigaspora rosea TaxID=44941 RepID=A0A397UTW6_9GLOM|nr:hypothetical protein C2G38_2041125 [Gigaspora rosea]
MIDLVDNLVPATLDVYALIFRSGQFNKYVEAIFRIWTFALRWKRKNYNKAPLVFLSDIFYWNGINHPFLNVLQEHLTCFTEYFVKNVHSKIRANTSQNATVDNIIKQAYVIMNHDCTFKDAYCKTRRYPYTLTALNCLYNKTALFLLQHFQDLYHDCEKSKPKPNNRRKSNPKSNPKSNKRGKKLPEIYHLATLNEDVNLQRLPTGYSTAHPPHPEFCDKCGLPFTDNNGSAFICGHGYHSNCYRGKCIHCEEFYKKGIFKNVKKFLERIEKGADTLTEEDVDNDDEDDVENVEENSGEVETIDILASLAAQIEQIKYW